MNFRRAILFSVLLEFSILLSAVLIFGFTLEALQTATRYSGRLSLVVFSFIFLTQNKKDKLTPCLSGRPYHIFAVIHGIHLIELLVFVYLSQPKLVPYRLLGGFVAYVFIFLMPLFDHYQKQKKISAVRFFTVETIFLYYVWLIFFITYLTRVLGNAPIVEGSYWEHVAFLGWVATMLGTKLISLIKFNISKQ
jgi:hypothetical protein